jgi:hypothetical protein
MKLKLAKRIADKVLRTVWIMLLLFWLITMVFVAAEVIHAWRIWMTT